MEAAIFSFFMAVMLLGSASSLGNLGVWWVTPLSYCMGSLAMLLSLLGFYMNLVRPRIKKKETTGITLET